MNQANPSADAARLLALELFREDKVSLGRAAELCETQVVAFMEFAGKRQVPLHRHTLERLPAHYSCPDWASRFTSQTV